MNNLIFKKSLNLSTQAFLFKFEQGRKDRDQFDFLFKNKFDKIL